MVHFRRDAECIGECSPDRDIVVSKTPEVDGTANEGISGRMDTDSNWRKSKYTGYI